MDDKVIYHFYESELEGWLENLGITPNKHRLEVAQDLVATFLNELDNEIESFLDMNRDEILSYDDEEEHEPEEYETCDKCSKKLKKLSGEDLYLEVLDMVLCNTCHDEHKGIKKYWSYDVLADYYLCSNRLDILEAHFRKDSEL